jgi:uncharacterized hydrophobic protein (TIGR00271 family)
MKLSQLIQNVTTYFDLESELDEYDLIHDSIVKGIIFRGTNLWILMFAIIVASVGLNMNSTAVIIGAMLISPLMGPINGMGYSIATYNFELFRQSIKNFSFAVLTSLFASTTYFALSPISTAYSELLARTSPTIYDVLIALFGGAAGIVAITSKNKGNVIPGVAIATALMPPLCTAGYGLATAQFDFFFGAMYLFTINTVFIALAALVVSQVLKFPIRTVVEYSQRKKVNRWIWSVLMIVVLPSIYFGYQLVQKEKFSENAKNYIEVVSIYEGNYLLNSEVLPGKKEVKLIYGGVNLTKNQKIDIARKAISFGIDQSKVEIKQGLTFDNFDNRNLELVKIKKQLDDAVNELALRDHKIDSIKNRGMLGKSLLREINALYPQLSGCAYAETYAFIDTLENSFKTALIYFRVNKNNVTKEESSKINHWIRRRLDADSVIVMYDLIR